MKKVFLEGRRDPLCEMQLISQVRQGLRTDHCLSDKEVHCLELSDFGGVVGEWSW